jgi:hypothetical protein
MRYYVCDFLDAQFQSSGGKVIKCANDDEAIDLCRDIFALSDGYRGVELWEGARRVYVFPRDELEWSGNNAPRHRINPAD